MGHNAGKLPNNWHKGWSSCFWFNIKKNATGNSQLSAP
jgi:hypothetical protein